MRWVHSTAVRAAWVGLLVTSLGCHKAARLEAEGSALQSKTLAAQKEIETIDGHLRAMNPGLRFAAEAHLENEVEALQKELGEIEAEIARWERLEESTEELKARFLAYRERHLEGRAD